MKKYNVEFTEPEIHTLVECLATIRSQIVESTNGALGRPLFVAASELQHKLGLAINPTSDLTVDDYLDMGRS